jgi:hypothetical protein
MDLQRRCGGNDSTCTSYGDNLSKAQLCMWGCKGLNPIESRCRQRMATWGWSSSSAFELDFSARSISSQLCASTSSTVPAPLGRSSSLRLRCTSSAQACHSTAFGRCSGARFSFLMAVLPCLDLAVQAMVVIGLLQCWNERLYGRFATFWRHAVCVCVGRKQSDRVDLDWVAGLPAIGIHPKRRPPEPNDGGRKVIRAEQ